MTLQSVFSIFYLLQFLFSSSLGLGCTVPPAYWCDRADIAEECGVSDQCAEYNSSVYKQKIKLSVVYEALCPGCDEFVAITLYNITWLEWEGWKFIDLELIPYGNAHSVVLDDGSYAITCQHGPDECWMNKVHSCVMAVMGDSRAWLPIISCMHQASNVMHVLDAADQCLKKPAVSAYHRHLIWACQNSTFGDELQRRAADRTDRMSPDQHMTVPWIAINGVSLRSMQYLSEYGHKEPILYYALRHWFRGGRDPKMNKFGKRPKWVEEEEEHKEAAGKEKKKCLKY